jgi:uncharacterized sulfatase
LIGDDHGYPYYGFTGNEIVRTPNLDGLARGGTVFPFTHTTGSICAPSLNSLLTGLYPIQWQRRMSGLRALGFRGVRRRNAIGYVPTLPRILGEAGYASFQAGKYWEGSHTLAGFTEGTVTSPEAAQRGGDHAFGRKGIQSMLDFIDRNAARPFFLWFAPMLPHAPFDPPDEYRKLYRGNNLSPSAEAYYANCSWFDDLVGQLLHHLETRGLRERTLVVYLSDNGWDQPPFAGPGTKGKATMHELGFRTPLVFHWPGHVPAGAKIDRLVSTVDLLPTLCDYAGARTPAGLPGIDLRPAIEGRAAPERDALFGMMAWRGESGEGAPLSNAPGRGAKLWAYYFRDRDWHYIWYAAGDDGKDELYDKRRDPGEDHDVSGEQADKTGELRRRIRDWEKAALDAVSALPTPPRGRTPEVSPSSLPPKTSEAPSHASPTPSPTG